MKGRTLSHFRILEKLGEGGMGVVYRAEDERLHRLVALKVLPPDLVGNQERRLRFLREARAAAAVSHPNIATIYEVGDAEGDVFIAMELVEGKTLRHAMGGRPLPLKRILKIAVEIAEALARAHSLHVVHRDLKPENIAFDANGHVKILDFGLAKLLENHPGSRSADLSRLRTISGEMTQAGRILGTAAYMSPEQARGEPVDSRSDLFSFGIVLYEMMTGRLPFHGRTDADTLSAIIRDRAVPAVDVNPVTPAELQRIIDGCLEKDPDERTQHADQLAVDLRKLKRTTDTDALAVRTPDSAVAPGPRAPMGAATRARDPRQAIRRRLELGGAAAIAVLGVVIGGYFALRRGVTIEPADRSAAAHPAYSPLTRDPGEERFPALSPDGRELAYASPAAGNWDIYLLRVGGASAINLTRGTSADDTHPAFSPDGQRIAFRSDREGGGIFIMGATGESVRRLTDKGYHPDWSPDGTEIAYSTEGIVDPSQRSLTSEIWVVEVSSGKTRKLPITGDAVQPHWSPHGLRIAYWANTGGQRDVWTVLPSGSAAVRVTSDPAVDWCPIWSPTGDALYFASDRGGSMNLWKVRIDEQTGNTHGDPEPLTVPTTWAETPTISSSGARLSFVSATGSGNIQRVPFDPVTGKVRGRPIPVTRDVRKVAFPAPSPDGAWIAFSTWGEKEDLFIIRPDGSDLRQLTDDIFKDRRPRWSPDGKRLLFYSNRGGDWDIWTMNPNGGELTQITHTPDHDEIFPDWSPDGTHIIFCSELGISTLDVTVDFERRVPKAIPNVDAVGWNIRFPAWSPDGRRLAFQRQSGGSPRIEIVAYDLATRKTEILADLGEAPVWLNDSRRLLYHTSRTLLLLDTRSKISRQVLIVDPSEDLALPSLSADNRDVYLIVSRREADIWLMEMK